MRKSVPHPMRAAQQSSLCRWSKDEQRVVFQPGIVIVFVMTLLWFGGTGVHHRNGTAPYGRVAWCAHRHLARARTLRQARRSCVPNGRPGAATHFRAYIAALVMGEGHLRKYAAGHSAPAGRLREMERQVLARMIIAWSGSPSSSDRAPAPSARG